MKRIALIRSASSAVSKKQYNIQEIGLAKELAKLGMYVDVFLISDKKVTYCEKIGFEDRVNVYWLKGYKIPGQQGYYPDLKKILDKENYDLVQALDDSQITTVLTSSYCAKRKINFVLWQGMYENYPETYKRIIQYVFDWTLLKVLKKNTHHCLAKTNSAKQYLEEKNFGNIGVIPVALELANFDNDDKIDYRKKLNIPPNQKILLYVGKVEERRKPKFCLDVFNKLRALGDDCCLVYVGNGPMLEEVHQYAKQLHLDEVHFIDSIPQHELAELYCASDMFILPTRYEIFGMVLMEAMYFGTPVITYKAAGPLDVISNNIDGIVMDQFDSDIWAKNIHKHMFVTGDCKKMGQLGAKKIRENYLWPVVAKKYFDAYMKIIG